MTNERSSFTNQLGFVLAAAGSAVGLGNIWRFPYLAAKYGGGIFLLVYIILAVTFGFALMITEIAIGRKTGLSAIEAYKALDKRFAFVGILGTIVPVIIFPYYCVIGGWVVKYFVAYLAGQGAMAAGGDYFSGFIAQAGSPVLWLAVFMVLTSLVVMCGVQKGVEKASRIMMPVLVVLAVVIVIFVLTMPGAWEGVKYYITPSFSDFSVTTILAAMGQLFYSMSLAMGIMITYGSYMKKEDNLEKSVGQIEIFDTGIALLAGLMIVPAVFVFSGGDKEALNAGPGLMFVTLPKVFDAMPFGHFVGGIFFLLVLFAALTSAISLMETIVSILQDKLHWNRIVTCLVVLVGGFLIGLLSALGYSVWDNVKILGMQMLDFFDFISNSVLMPIVALFTSIFVGWILKTKVISDEVKISSKFHREKLFHVVIRYIAPVFLIAILVSSVLSAFGWIKI